MRKMRLEMAIAALGDCWWPQHPAACSPLPPCQGQKRLQWDRLAPSGYDAAQTHQGREGGPHPKTHVDLKRTSPQSDEPWHALTPDDSGSVFRPGVVTPTLVLRWALESLVRPPVRWFSHNNNSCSCGMHVDPFLQKIKACVFDPQPITNFNETQGSVASVWIHVP